MLLVVVVQFAVTSTPHVEPETCSLSVHVVARDGTAIPGTTCRLIVGAYPMGKNGLPGNPSEENVCYGTTDAQGIVKFEHSGLASEKRHILYVKSEKYVDATRLLEKLESGTNDLTVVLFGKHCATLRYVFQPKESLRLSGEGVVEGRVKLYPMEGGSYRSPARAHFSFKQNRRVGSGGVLDMGIQIDEHNGQLYFAGSVGRFNHCTDLGPVDFNDLTIVDTDMLERKREDTLIQEGHVYVFESNIYEPSRRTKFTGFDVHYAKILVESVDLVDITTEIRFEPATPIADKTLTIHYKAGSADLDAAKSISVYWNTYGEQGQSFTSTVLDKKELAEFPAGPRGTTGGCFDLARKKCFVRRMVLESNGYWMCRVNLPGSARSLALLFVDEIGRTIKEGIQKYEVSP